MGSCQEPTEYLLQFDVRRVKAKLRGFGFDSIICDQQVKSLDQSKWLIQGFLHLVSVRLAVGVFRTTAALAKSQDVAFAHSSNVASPA